MWIETDDGGLVNLDHASGIDFREHHGQQERVSSYSVFAEMSGGSKVIRTFRVERHSDAKQVEAEARAFMGTIRDTLKGRDRLIMWEKPRRVGVV